MSESISIPCRYCKSEVEMVDVQPTQDRIGRQYLKGVCPECGRTNLISEKKYLGKPIEGESMETEMNEPENDTSIDASEDIQPDAPPDNIDMDEEGYIDEDIESIEDTSIDDENERNNPTPSETLEESSDTLEEDPDPKEDSKGRAATIILIAVVSIIAVAIIIWLMLPKNESGGNGDTIVFEPEPNEDPSDNPDPDNTGDYSVGLLSFNKSVDKKKTVIWELKRGYYAFSISGSIMIKRGFGTYVYHGVHVSMRRNGMWEYIGTTEKSDRIQYNLVIERDIDAVKWELKEEGYPIVGMTNVIGELKVRID